MNTSCVVCQGSSIRCSKCEIHNLKSEIKGLKEKIRYMELHENDIIQLSEQNKQKNYSSFKITHEPQTYEYKDFLSLCQFYTITFDPKKFGSIRLDKSEAFNYILHHLLHCYKQFHIFSLYGCIELHQNGNPHAHLIIHSNYHRDIKQYLLSKFSDNMFNKVCIDVGPARYPQAKEYIDKESTLYFSKHNVNDLKALLEHIEDSEGLYEPVSESTKKSIFDLDVPEIKPTKKYEIFPRVPLPSGMVRGDDGYIYHTA